MKKNETKKKKKKIIKKEIDTLDKIMIGVLVLLGIYIVFLGFRLVFEISKNRENKVKANIVIPVLNKSNTSSITLNMNEFNEKAVYIFKVNNYRNNDVNKEKIKYTIRVLNTDQTNLILTKNESDKNLANTEKEFEVPNNSLKAKEKQSDIYRLKIKDKNNIKSDSKVIISIDS